MYLLTIEGLKNRKKRNKRKNLIYIISIAILGWMLYTIRGEIKFHSFQAETATAQKIVHSKEYYIRVEDAANAQEANELFNKDNRVLEISTNEHVSTLEAEFTSHSNLAKQVASNKSNIKIPIRGNLDGGHLILHLQIQNDEQIEWIRIKFYIDNILRQEYYIKPYDKNSNIDTLAPFIFDISSPPYKIGETKSAPIIQKFTIDFSMLTAEEIDLFKKNFDAANRMLLNQKSGIQFKNVLENDEADFSIYFGNKDNYDSENCTIQLRKKASTKILAHELCHALGLDDLVDNNSCLLYENNMMMNGESSCNSLGTALTYGQILLIHGHSLLFGENNLIIPDNLCNQLGAGEYQYISNLNENTNQGDSSSIRREFYDTFENDKNMIKEGDKIIFNNFPTISNTLEDTMYNIFDQILSDQLNVYRNQYEDEYDLLMSNNDSTGDNMFTKEEYVEYNLNALLDLRARNISYFLDNKEININPNFVHPQIGSYYLQFKEGR